MNLKLLTPVIIFLIAVSMFSFVKFDTEKKASGQNRHHQ